LKEWIRPLQFLLTIGWYVALSLIIPVLIGYWLDQPSMFNKRPLFILIGLGVGTFVAFLAYLKCSSVIRLSKKKKEKIITR